MQYDNDDLQERLQQSKDAIPTHFHPTVSDYVFLRVVGATIWIQKYAKICCHKTTWAIILMTPIHLLEASGAPMFTLEQGGWIIALVFLHYMSSHSVVFGGLFTYKCSQPCGYMTLGQNLVFLLWGFP